jgi:hypothetical protein
MDGATQQIIYPVISNIIYAILTCVCFAFLWIVKIGFSIKKNQEKTSAEIEDFKLKNEKTEIQLMAAYLEDTFFIIKDRFERKEYIPERLLQSWYRIYGEYKKRGGNGSIDDLKRRIDEMVDEQLRQGIKR